MFLESCFVRRRDIHSHWVAVADPGLIRLFCDSLGSNVVPVTSSRLAWLHLAGQQVAGWVLDVDQLTPAEVERLARRLGEVDGTPPLEMRARLYDRGLNLPWYAGELLRWCEPRGRVARLLAPSVN